MEMLFQKQFARKRTPMIRKPIARHANRPNVAKKPFVIGHRKEVVPTDLSRKPQHVKKPFFVKFR
jgi:hypothetical protein|tara:strand:- start:967 stop:1161 length:195 start_codon:yes stop_codon:yes gene_type:complete